MQAIYFDTYVRCGRCSPVCFQVALEIADGKGTKENDYCSNHGVCDFETGTCLCDRNTTFFPNEWYWWESSDGYGGPGGRGDCGYQREESTANVNQSCPVGVVFEDETTPTYETMDKVSTAREYACRIEPSPQGHPNVVLLESVVSTN